MPDFVLWALFIFSHILSLLHTHNKEVFHRFSVNITCTNSGHVLSFNIPQCLSRLPSQAIAVLSKRIQVNKMTENLSSNLSSHAGHAACISGISPCYHLTFGIIAVVLSSVKPHYYTARCTHCQQACSAARLRSACILDLHLLLHHS